MKKDIFVFFTAVLMLVLIGAHSGWAKVNRIIDEDEVKAFSGESYAVPNGLAKTSRGTYIFFETTADSILEYNPGTKKFSTLADKAVIESVTTDSEVEKLRGCDLALDSNDSVYFMVEGKGRYYIIRVPYSQGKYQSAEKIVRLRRRRGRLGAYALAVDKKRNKLVILIDTYRGEDDADFNGIYTFDLNAEIPGEPNEMVRLAGFKKIGRAATPQLIACQKPIGGTGFAIDDNYAYFHLTVGPADGHGADGDLVRINLDSGESKLFLDRKEIIEDIKPDGVGAEGNFYATTLAVDGDNLFMMVSIGVYNSAQNVHLYDISGDKPVYKGMAASAEELLGAANSLGTPIIVYSPDCEAKDGKFYIFSASNLKENLLEIIPDGSAPCEPIRVAIYSGPGGSGKGAFRCLSECKYIEPQKVSPNDIQNGILQEGNFDVVLHPGGSGSGQAKAIGEKGRENVRDFVKNGGGYVGICAGAYLASSNYPWSLNIIDAIVIERAHWARGGGPVTMQLTAEGRRIIDDISEPVVVRYGQGALYAPAKRDDLGDYRVLATFTTGTTEKNNTKSSTGGALEAVMRGAPAMVAGEYGKGRVVVISPHPETKNSGIEYFVHRLVRFAAAQPPRRNVK